MSFLLKMFGMSGFAPNIQSCALSTTISLLLVIVACVAYSVAKKFVNTEFDKLNGADNTVFDRLIALAFSAVISAVIMIVSMVIMKIVLSVYTEAHILQDGVYYKLMVLFPVMRTVFYTVIAPHHPSLRLVPLSDHEAGVVFGKLVRVINASLAVLVVEVSVSSLLSANNVSTFGYIVCFVSIIYYFMEVRHGHTLLTQCCCIATNGAVSLSSKLVSFINNKFPSIVLICMVSVLVSYYLSHIGGTDTGGGDFFLNVFEEIVWVLVTTVILQMAISFTLNTMLTHLVYGDDNASPHKKNLMWICDVVVLSLYIFIMCVVLQYIGINIKDYLFKDKVIVVCSVVFLTIVIFRGFNSMVDTVLARAGRQQTSRYMKVETFLPIVTIIFNVLLACASGCIVLSTLGISIAPILTVFGAVGLSLGAAAKDIIKSFLQGVMLLLEQDLYVGEEIAVNDVVGVVEKLSARVLYIRSVDGSLHIIPYNMVNTVTNRAKDYVNCMFELPISNDTNVGEVSDIIKGVISELRQEHGFSDAIMCDPVISGLKPFDLTGVTLCWSVKMQPGVYSKTLKFRVYTRLKEKFQEKNIPIASSNVVMPVT